MAEIRIGISGWNYAPWRGRFFPPGLRQRNELDYAARQVPSIEINGTFYSLQRPASYLSWHDHTPADFLFSVKGPRFLTHIKRLNDVRVPLANFFASGIFRLGKKLGPLLWQLPPNFPFKPERLSAFFELLPRDTHAAAALAREHSAILKEPWLEPGPKRRLRHALEVRHDSFKSPAFISLLRRHRIALVVADTAGKWPLLEDVTADFVYVRLHGDAELYVSGYTDAALARWAEKIRHWARGEIPPGAALQSRIPPRRKAGRDVFVYFDNDVKTHAPFDALKLAHRLGLAPPAPPMFTPEKPTALPAARTHWPAVRPKPPTAPRAVRTH